MKKKLLCASVLAASIVALAKGPSDPVLMTVAGKDVPLSEFEYLYHKNNTQQAQPQSIDQYVGMFINYKLKVADAIAAGIDTTAAFREEFTKFRNELAEPYLQDNSVMDYLIQEAYNHRLSELTVSHIMLQQAQSAEIDSLREVIVSGADTFENVARRYSIDQPSAVRGGLMGEVVPGRYPWAFEKAAYDTKVGEISPVVNSGFGLHIIRVEATKPARGEVKASHILRLTRNLSDDDAARQKTLIDSIYTVLQADPTRFEELAKEYSEDPGSARRGGDLGWFGGGMMVAEFDSTAFAMPVGTISQPFRTNYGWHIIRKDDARGVGSLEDNRAEIEKQIKNSERANEPALAFIRAAAAQHRNELPAGSFDENGEITSAGTEAVLELSRAELYKTNADYRNLVNEYRDGILLYEISNQNVWDRAAKDREGLEAYFQANKAKYAWDKPKFKAYVIFATKDSILNSALEYATTLPADIAPQEFVRNIREKFGRDIKIERVIAAEGENAITDYLGFGAEKPASDNQRWKYYAAYAGRIIDSPEESADVRGAAVADYQEVLEQEWLADLHHKYKVKVNAKVLKKAK